MRRLTILRSHHRYTDFDLIADIFDVLDELGHKLEFSEERKIID